MKEFLDEAFGLLNMDWKQYVEIDKHYFRPTEVNELLGDTSKAKRELGWKPGVYFKELVQIMVNADLEAEKIKLIGTQPGV